MVSPVLASVELARDLIRRPSVTPDDAGCQQIIAQRLEKLGFKIEHLQFGSVSNLWARRGTKAPLFVFAGHTDVVPTGPEDAWDHAPFEAKIVDGNLFGRGSADMKSAIAAALIAVQGFLYDNPDPDGSIGFLITSDEEGMATDGTVKVIEHLEARGEKIDYCVVGESTCVDRFGDMIKNGRRGSLSGTITVKGVQGHVAYPERADNPIHAFAPTLTELCAQKWDDGNEFFSPTTFQFSNLNSGTGADNVIPGELKGIFNFRFASVTNADDLKRRVHAILDKHKLKYEIAWRLSGNPFLTTPGTLIDAIKQAIKQETGLETELSTTGGTSDARFIAPTGAQVVEFGLINATIHKVNEHVKVNDIDALRRVYGHLIENLIPPH